VTLSITDPKAEQLVRELTQLTGESLTEAVVQALEERLERLKIIKQGQPLAEVLDHIARQCAKLPILTTQSPEEILGYDEHGLFDGH